MRSQYHQVSHGLTQAPRNFYCLQSRSLCPLKASEPITGTAAISVPASQIERIPDVAFSIPDFEGSTKLQIFANSSKTEIGCFQAVMGNGVTLSQPKAIAPILGVFTVVAIVAAFLTAAYGVSVPHMRMHYAHSLSVLVIFETFQSFFFTGALSVDWPRVLVAWWSNFAWSAGLIHSSGIANSIGSFTGVIGNASQVGGAGSVVINNGGGLAGQIYGSLKARVFNDANAPYDYSYAGVPVAPGMPMPGTWYGFSGALSEADVPAAGAFLVGLIWLLVAVGLVMLCVLSLKFALEALAGLKWIKEDRMDYFREHWLGYLTVSVLRTLFIAFFMIATLALFQLNVKAPVGVTTIAAVTFAIFVIGTSALVGLACRARLRFGNFSITADQLILHRGKLFKVIPCVAPVRASTLKEQESAARPIVTVSWFRIRHIDDDPSRVTVHDDETFVKSFGWLSARYRRTRWWFFAYYLGYQFIRACFLGGGVQSPLAQVYGLFIVEIFAFLIIVKYKPFEGTRNMTLAVWMLGITKVTTTGLSIAFLPDFSLDRIVATVLAFIIIAIQGLLVIALMILVVLGAISSWMSLSRNREDISPEFLDGIRTRYFEKMEAKARDGPDPHKQDEEKNTELDEFKEQFFSAASVPRARKTGGEEADIITSLGVRPPPHLRPATARPSSVHGRVRVNSLHSRRSVGNLPRSGRQHRASWSAKDFAQWDAELSAARPSGAMLAKRRSGGGNGVGLTSRPTSGSSLRVVQTVADMEHPSPLGPGRPNTPSKRVGSGEVAVNHPLPSSIQETTED